MILELDDIQSGILRPRPTPYAATYLLVRIDDPIAGRKLMQRASEVVASARADAVCAAAAAASAAQATSASASNFFIRASPLC